MKVPLIVIATVLVSAGLFVALKMGSQTPPASTEESAATTSEATSPPTNVPASTGLNLTGATITGNYYEFSQADYDAAKTAGRPIFLFFYANWCPTCAAQEPIVKQLMTEIADESKLDDIIAFRVNFNDNATSEDEEMLAETFGVRYQHTMFVLNEDGQTIKKFLGQTDTTALRAAFTAATE